MADPAGGIAERVREYQTYFISTHLIYTYLPGAVSTQIRCSITIDGRQYDLHIVRFLVPNHMLIQI